MIRVQRVSGGYTAHATAPHVRSEWQTNEPLPAREIIRELQERGVHQTDIGDAFYQADPHWISKLEC
jgi:hypothetical protein